MASLNDKLSSPLKHPFRFPEEESTPAKGDLMRKGAGQDNSPPFLLQPKLETFYPNVQADSMPTSVAHRFMKMEAAFNSRSDSESRREQGVKLMNLEKFIEVNNFMPVPPQKPPTANTQTAPAYHQINKGTFSALGTRNQKLTPYKDPRAGIGNSKYVNLSMESKSQSSESFHEQTKQVAFHSHHPYPMQNRMAEMALQMYGPQPSIKIKREVSRKNSISSQKSNSNSFEESKQPQLKKIQAPLTTPQIGSVTPTSLFKNAAPGGLQNVSQLQQKKVSSTQPTSRSASMNLSRGMEVPGMPHRLFSQQNFSGIGMAPPYQPRHERVLSLDAKLPSSRIENPKLLKKQILETLGRGHMPKNVARFNPPPHQIQSILASVNPARFIDQDKILQLRNYRKTMDPPQALPIEMQGKPSQIKIKRNFLDSNRGRAFTNHALFDMNVFAGGMEAERSRLINLAPTEKFQRVFQQQHSQFSNHKKTESFQFGGGQTDMDLSYLQELRNDNSKRYGTAMSQERVLKTGSSPLTRPKIVKNKLPAPFKQNLRQFKDNRDIGTAQTSAATFGHGGGNIFTPPHNNQVPRNIYKNISVNASVAMTEIGENKAKKESIIEVQSCSLTDEEEEDSANFDRAVRKLDFSNSKQPAQYRQIHSEATPQMHRELDNFSVLLPYPQPTIKQRTADPISESYFTNIKKWNRIEPLVTTPLGKLEEGAGAGMKSTIKPVHRMGPLDNSGGEMVHRTPQLKRQLVSEVKPRKGLFSRPGERQKVSYTPSTAATSQSLKLERPFSGRFSLGPKVRFSKKQETKGQ